MINNCRKLHYFSSIFTIVFICFLFPVLAQQNEIILNEEFLEGLPPDVADLLEENNEATKEARENEELFRFDTSLESQKIILENLQLQVDELRSRLGDNQDSDKLVILASDMPVGYDLDDFKASTGIDIVASTINNNTTIYFAPDSSGNSTSLTLDGIVDGDLSNTEIKNRKTLSMFIKLSFKFQLY